MSANSGPGYKKHPDHRIITRSGSRKATIHRLLRAAQTRRWSA